VATTSTTRGGTIGEAWLLAAASAGAGIIHVSVILEHRGGDPATPVSFALTAWFQLVTAFLVLRTPRSRPLLATMAAGNALALGAWALTRTVGLPFIHDGVPEEAALLDVVCAALEAGVVVLALGALLLDRQVTRPLAFAGAGTVLVLATVAMVVPEDTVPTMSASGTSSDGHSHSHGGAAAAASTAGGDHATQMLAIDRSRCDLDFNPQAYWDESLAMGVDTYAGGDMTSDDHETSAVTDVAGHIQLGGRGSERFDTLVSLASRAEGEASAAQLVVQLSEASDAEYDAFSTWVRTQAAGGGGHSHGAPAASTTAGTTAAAPATNSNIQSMGHVGPGPWRAMVDPVACDRLADELGQARETALALPTVADAVRAGYFRVTPYVPGIAAHYMNFGLVDGEFDITKPEMILYDGTKPESRVVGLSYYVRLDGSAQPTQGFTGDNDHYHRHFGLCVGAGGVIGDSTTTDAECAARGGVKANGTDGWMSHAWVVPGCESPWGVFSAVNPLLDGALGGATGKQEGCAGSSVRDRYDLSPGRSDLPSRTTSELAVAGG
jgi:hypothetical protein